jgi:hypothetical protein
MPLANEADNPVATELFFPHFVSGGGYTTQFILFGGQANQSSSGYLRLFTQSGEALP